MFCSLLLLVLVLSHYASAILADLAKPAAAIDARAVAATSILAPRQNGNIQYPTHTFRPLSKYQYKGTDAPTPTIATDLIITAKSSDSIVLIAIGTAIGSALDAAVSTACPQLNSPECAPRLYNATDPTEVALQSRQVVSATVFLAAFLAILFGQLRFHKADPKNANLAAVEIGEVSEIAALPSSPGAVFVLSSDDPNPVTVGPNGDVLGTAATYTTASRQALYTWSCMHTADPQNTCSAIKNGAGWCECNADGSTYAITISKSSTGCAYSTKPPTTTFACPTAHPPTITKAPSPPAIVVPGFVSVTTFTGPAKGHVKGDVGIVFDSDEHVSAIQDLLNGYIKCTSALPAATPDPARKKVKRGGIDTIGCSSGYTLSLMTHTLPGGTLQWIWNNIPQDGFRIPDLIDVYQVAIDSAYAAAESLAGLTIYTSAQKRTVVKILFWITITNKVLKQTRENANLVIPVTDLLSTEKGEVTPTAIKTRPSSTSSCPDGLTMPNCMNCGGELGTSACSGTLGKWSKCPCNAPTEYPYLPFPNLAALESAATLFGKYGTMTRKPSTSRTMTENPSTSALHAGTGTAPLGAGPASQTENDHNDGTSTADGIPLPSNQAAPGGKYLLSIRNYSMLRLGGTVYQVIKVAWDDGNENWITYHNVYAPNWSDPLYPGEVIVKTSGDMFSQHQKINLIVVNNMQRIAYFDETTTKAAAGGKNYCDPPGAWQPETDYALPYRDVVCHVLMDG